MTLRPRWRKVLTDLWDNKLRTILVVLSIAIGVFSVGMISGAYVIISNDMGASYASANPANIELWTDAFDQDFVNSIKDVPGVKNAEGRRFVSMRVRVNDERWESLDLVAIEDFSNINIGLLIPIEGGTIPEDQQVILERDALEDIPVQVGDSLEFLLPNGKTKTMLIAGVVQDQTTGAGDFLAPPIGFITFNTLEWLGQPSSYNRLLVTVSESSNDPAHIRAISTNVTDKVERSSRQVYRTQLSKSNEHPMTSTVQAVLGVLGALGILVVLLSSSLIANTLNALLNQHLRHIGVMKLIGARSSQIMQMYVVLILCFGAIALAIAVPLGGQGAYALSVLISSQLNFNLLGYRIIPLAILAQAIIAVIVPLAAGFVPVNNGSRITVQKAISGDTSDIAPVQDQTETKSGWLQKIGHRLPRPLLLSLRNTFRRKGRLLLTLFTLTMGGAIFIAVFNVRVTLNQYIEQIGNYFVADVTLNLDRPYRLKEIGTVAKQIPGVVDVEGWSFTNAEVLYPNGGIAENITILAPPAESQLVEPIIIAGRWLQPGDRKALAASEEFLNTFPELKPGDLLTIKINGEEDTWEVVGIFQFVSGQGVLAYANYEYISELLNLANRSFSYRISTEQHSEAYQEAMSQVIDEHFRRLGYDVRDVEPGLSSLDTASEGLNVLVTFLLVMALLTATVGSMGLAGTMGMNVLERTREIGVMRSIGAVDLEIIKSVIVEGMVIGMISWLFGALLSFPISVLLSNIISLAIFSTPIDLVFTFQGFAIWLVLVLILSAGASVLPARNAARLTIREVLAYE
jgi:putative ABC transport system permease protein